MAVSVSSRGITGAVNDSKHDSGSTVLGPQNFFVHFDWYILCKVFFL